MLLIIIIITIVILVKDMDLNRNKRKFKDAVHVRYDWQIGDVPNVCVCGEPFNVDHAITGADLGGGCRECAPPPQPA